MGRLRCPNDDCVISDTTHGDKDKYCWNCGEMLVEFEPEACKCGRVPGAVDKFCPSCGRKVKQNPIRKE